MEHREQNIHVAMRLKPRDVWSMQFVGGLQWVLTRGITVVLGNCD